MKKLLILLTVTLLKGTFAVANDGDIFTVTTVEGVPMSFRVTSELLNTCEVYSAESTAAIPQNTAGTVTIPEWANDYSVNAIGEKAFYNCKKLENVIIPDGIIRIGSKAFYECLSLTSIDIPQSVIDIEGEAFKHCKSLTSVVLPDQVTRISGGLFRRCYGLTSVKFSENLTNIDEEAFRDCIALADVVFPNSLKVIEDDAFHHCASITNIQIPASVNKIGENPFCDCYNLSSITVASENAVYDSRENCNAIIETGQDKIITACNSTVIPDGTKSIANKAFRAFRGLTSLNIPASLTEIPDNLSEDFIKDMTTITVDNGNPMFDSRNNCNAIIETTSNKLILGCQNTIIPQNVTTIGKNAFEKCLGLKSIDIPTSVTMIENEAFKKSGLTSVTIPSNVKTIGNQAFEDCLDMTSVSLADGLETLGYDVFGKCKILSLIIPKSVTQIGDNSKSYLFTGCINLNSIVVENGNFKYDSRNNCNAIIETSSNHLINGCMNTVIPESVTEIGRSAFEDCIYLKELYIPKNVRKIGSSAFSGCGNLESITVAKGNTTYDSRSNCNAIIETGSKTLIRGCNNTVIPESITTIGNGAFNGCPITSITIPANITSFEGLGCLLLESISSLIEEPFELSENIFATNPIYKNYPLYYNNEYTAGLHHTLEENYNVSYSSFYEDEMIEYLMGEITLYVPAGTKAKYEATPCWNEFKEIIEIGGSPTTIEAKTSRCGLKETEYYTLSGMRIVGQQQGLNIVRMADGTVRKVVLR